MTHLGQASLFYLETLWPGDSQSLHDSVLTQRPDSSHRRPASLELFPSFCMRSFPLSLCNLKIFTKMSCWGSFWESSRTGNKISHNHPLACFSQPHPAALHSKHPLPTLLAYTHFLLCFEISPCGVCTKMFPIGSLLFWILGSQLVMLSGGEGRL